MATSICFNRFELFVQERELYQDGQPTSVGGRAIELLCALAERPGRLATKAELLARVWPGLVVEENNLQVQVSTLRKVLGPDAIATVPGRGYRFVAPLAPTAPPAAEAAPIARSTNLATGTAPSSPPAPPAPLPHLWGRAQDLEALDALLPAALITLVGPAGIGKTALAQAAAQRWRADRPDGTCWVDLAALPSGGCVASAVAHALGVSVGEADPLALLVEVLQPVKRLLVLDNAEHVLAAAARLVSGLVQAAPGVRMLVTSQVPLKVDGERVFRLGPLSVPEPGVSVDEAMRHGAVALFVDQVRAVDRHHVLLPAHVDLIVSLCRRLDGLPLAIKLAAARVPLLGVAGVVQRLEARFRLLAGHSVGVPERHQTLMAALDWSHGLLTPTEQALFRRLAIFRGGASLDLIRRLGTGSRPDDALDDLHSEWQELDTLSALVDRSLVTVVAGPAGAPPRYRLLDSMHDYAATHLAASGEHDLLAERHARAMADVLDTGCESYWHCTDDAWLAQHASDIDNVRAALAWATVHDPALAVRLHGAAAPLCLLLGLASEARHAGRALEGVAERMGTTGEAARFWLAQSRLHWGVDPDHMAACAERAVQAYRALDHVRGLYLALRCVAGSGTLDGDVALRVLRDMAAVESPAWPVRLLAQRQLAEVSVLRAQEQMADARRVCQDLLVRAQAAGLDAVTLAALNDLAAIHLALGDTESALRFGQDVVRRARYRDDPAIVHALAIMACVAFVRGDLGQARIVLSELLSVSAQRDWEWLGPHVGLLALLAALESRHEAAARLLGHAELVHQRLATRDVMAIYAWSRAQAILEGVLEPTVLQRLMGLGRALDEAGVSAWALGHATD